MRTLTVTIFTLCWLLAQLGLAQQAEKVVSPVKERHDSGVGKALGRDDDGFERNGKEIVLCR